MLTYQRNWDVRCTEMISATIAEALEITLIEQVATVGLLVSGFHEPSFQVDAHMRGCNIEKNS